MRKSAILLALSVFVLSAKAQVDDVSFIFTPKIGYNWFDPKSTVENGTMWGFQAGFGFGRVIELRGVYERSLNLKQNFGQYEGDIQNVFPNFNFADRSIDVKRIGGEFKTNIPIDGFSPFLILGTGVQTFKGNLVSGTEYKNENLYGTGGIGLRFALGDRVNFNIEGRGIFYNMNPGSLLYNEGGSSEFDDWIDNQDRSSMYNWSLMAGLQFYLGGRSEDEMSALDRAYLRRFSGGISGTKLTLSPIGSYVKFNSNSGFRDTYMLGGMVGVDFTNYVGLQGYYYKATEDKEISLNFDNLEMYGVDFVGRLNVPRGIVPYISVGGGYLNAHDSYVGKPIVSTEGEVTGYRPTSSGYYAKGGAGLEVPLSPYIHAFGGANIFYTIDDRSTDVTQIRNVEELSSHTMYNVGLRFNIGKGANTKRQTERAFERRFEGERSEYDDRISQLEAELKEAYETNDSERAVSIIEQKKAEEAKQQGTAPKSNLIRLTPAELESLIDKVLDGVDKQQEGTVEDRLDRLEQLLMMNQQRQRTVAGGTEPIDTRFDGTNEALMQEIRKLNQQLDQQRKDMETLQKNQGTNLQDNRTTLTPEVAPLPPVAPVSTVHNYGTENFRTFSPYVGVNFGDASTFNIGARGYYGFRNTAIMFAPEGYIALGDGLGFGVSANGVYPFRANDAGLVPYAGLGVGVHSLGSDFSFTTNVLGGVAYQLGNGSLTADYTIRGAFKNNQVALGYRFRF